MKIQTYTYPKSSFLSQEKDMEIITSMIMKNERLKKLLYYPTKDCLDKGSLTPEQNIALFGDHIKLVPKAYVDSNVKSYIIIRFDNFVRNTLNPEFRNNIIEFDIICHFDQWQLKDFQLRPYKIAAELDSMFDKTHLTRIGKLEFISPKQMVFTDEYAGVCLKYVAIHGEEDKKFKPNPADDEQFLAGFDKMFNEK